MEELLREFSDMLTMDLVEAINNHAQPRPYDYWLLSFTALSIILSFSAIIATIIIAKRQVSISEKQTDIMEQQNKIALFEKRYTLYNSLLTLKLVYNLFNRPQNEITQISNISLVRQISATIYKDFIDEPDQIMNFKTLLKYHEIHDNILGHSFLCHQQEKVKEIADGFISYLTDLGVDLDAKCTINISNVSSYIKLIDDVLSELEIELNNMPKGARPISYTKANSPRLMSDETAVSQVEV